MHAPGKVVVRRRYLRVDAGCVLEPDLERRLAAAEALAGRQRGRDYQLARFDLDGPGVALLVYPALDDDPFPALAASWRVDPAAGTVGYRTYADSDNPPILHRKELLLPAEHPRRAASVALTAACEALGLFAEPRRIGYRRQWLALIRDRGYRLVDHALLPLGNDDADDSDPNPDDPAAAAPLPDGWRAARQRTALTRAGWSAPLQSLARHGLLDGDWSLFDYGCGRGDDVRGLRAAGLNAAGWDPYHAPDGPIVPADIVNLGFVVNVIEDPAERCEALTRAWSLARRLLVVAVMLANRNAPRGTPFGDGVLTQRGTFQKYYTQAEIQQFVATTLDAPALPVAPGVLYVFRDPADERRVLLDRRRPRREPAPVTRARPERPERPVRVRRDPGAARQAAQAREQARTTELRVYLALRQFAPARSNRDLDPELRRELRRRFGSQERALAEARALLFAIADPQAIATACQQAAEQGLGWLEPGRSLQLHTRLLERLPPLLRVYAGCAAALYGDCRAADLIKLHLTSGKVSLMRYDDFDGAPLPRLLERVKIKLRAQDFDYFAYGDDHDPPYLFHKSRYINEEFDYYPEQRAFEAELADLGLFDLSGYGPPPAVLRATLARQGWTVDGFRLARLPGAPDLDAPCGRYLTYRELIRCGATQAATGLANLPRQPATWEALWWLATRILDPAIDYFGMIRLTYGFCAPELARAIRARDGHGPIDPSRDQHAAHEVNRLGRPICPRLGAAVDFLVEDESMNEVARWIVDNTPFGSARRPRCETPGRNEINNRTETCHHDPKPGLAASGRKRFAMG